MKVICTTIEAQRGTLTGRYVDGDCSGAEKVRRIRAHYDLSRYPIVYAYGDSGEDREMMALADKKYYPLERDRELGRGQLVRPSR